MLVLESSLREDYASLLQATHSALCLRLHLLSLLDKPTIGVQLHSGAAWRRLAYNDNGNLSNKETVGLQKNLDCFHLSQQCDVVAHLHQKAIAVTGSNNRAVMSRWREITVPLYSVLELS